MLFFFAIHVPRVGDKNTILVLVARVPGGIDLLPLREREVAVKIGWNANFNSIEIT